jgi:hypothetical protein
MLGEGRSSAGGSPVRLREEGRCGSLLKVLGPASPRELFSTWRLDSAAHGRSYPMFLEPSFLHSPELLSQARAPSEWPIDL